MRTLAIGSWPDRRASASAAANASLRTLSVAPALSELGAIVDAKPTVAESVAAIVGVFGSDTGLGSSPGPRLALRR